MSATYRVTLTDRLGQRYGLLPAYGDSPLEYSSVLNGGGEATITPQLTLPLISGKQNRRRLTSWGSAVTIERLTGPGFHGVVFEGPVTKPHAEVDGDSLKVTVGNPWAWSDERIVDTNQVFAAQDQLNIVRSIGTEYLTDKRGSEWDTGIRFVGTLSGQKVTEQYLGTDMKTVRDVVDELAQAQNGFDFDMVPALDPVRLRPVRMWVPYYPRKTRDISTKISPGKGGLRGFTIEEATQIATRVRGTGGGEVGTGNYEAKAATAVEQFYGVHARAASLSDSNSRQKLRAQIDDYLRYRTPPVEIVTFQFAVSEDLPYGVIQTGDNVPVMAERGWSSYDDVVRVIGLSVSVDPSGTELVTCTAAGIPDGID